jgi:hypothetical protein
VRVRDVPVLRGAWCEQQRYQIGFGRGQLDPASIERRSRA